MRIRNILKNFLLVSLPIIGGVAFAAIVSRVTSFTDGQVLTAAQLNSEFNNLVNNMNALNDDNLTDSANIDPKKLNASIAGDGIGRNGSTGILEANADDSTIEVSADALQLKDDGTTNAKLADADALSVIGNGTNASANPTYITATVDGYVLRRSGTSVGFGQVTSAGIEDGAITNAKLHTVNYIKSSSSGGFTTASSSYVDITNFSVSITTEGRPVLLSLQSDEAVSANGNNAQIFASAAADFAWLRSGTALAYYSMLTQTSVGGFLYIDQPSAGTYTYKMQARVSSGALSVLKCKMVAREL